MRMKVALAIYLVIGMIDIVLGVIYFFSEQFLTYHAQAVGKPWIEVDTGTRTLILALMKLAGGGWLALGFFTVILAWVAFRRRSTVFRWALPAGTIVFYSASLAATWGVYQKTGSPTPWVPSLAMIGFALLAFIIDAPWTSRSRDKTDASKY